ncbi:hypothetical protein [Limnohabitans sp.]|uniref:beta strand repeat-containing protein n=2 Tax=Limnohabitans sp. TaxID=1907725 RepID=UPI0025BFB1DB|nr:hypothetical protein [Limnohabitans sp.]
MASGLPTFVNNTDVTSAAAPGKTNNAEDSSAAPSLSQNNPAQAAALLYPSSSISKVYQHWADGDAARGTSPEWNNNILSDGKSDYFEGEVVPHVFFYKASNNTPLVNGQTYSFNVTYNYYQGNTNAGGFVYMTSPNADRSPTSFAGGDAQPDSTFTNGGGMQGAFNTVNANITAVSGVTYSGDTGSSLSGKVTVTFVYTGPTTTSGGAEIQYGLMIAAPGDVPDQGKGTTDGANAWTGGSLQTTVDIGGSGATSIQLAPSAIIVGEISGMKFSDMDGNGIRDADGADNQLGTADDEVGLANWKIFLDQDNDGQWDTGEQFALTDAQGKYALSVVPDADRSDPDNDPYIVREVQQMGWVQTTINPAPILITALDPKEMNVDFGNMMLKPSLNIVKEASVPGGTADTVGEIISYTIAVQNTGNQTLTGVTVNDPFISNLVLVADAASADGELDVGETWQYTASHVVTQAEIDAGGNITNVATADSNQTDPDTDDASVPVGQSPALNIVKEASVPGGTADTVGEIISYTIAVQNTGNQTLTGVTVNDPFISNLVLVADAASADGELDVGETWQYTASHVVTQAEIDAGGNITNVATADSNQTDPDTDDASVPVGQSPALNIVKEASVPGGTADTVGEIISYTIAVQNTGNQTLTGVTVNDPFISNLVLVADAASADGELDVGETWQYTASHVVTQAEIDAGGNITNVATADSNQTDPDTDDASVPVAQAPAIAIDKAIVNVSGGNGNGTLDAVGDVINYAIVVSNPGNMTLNDVTVSDPFTNLVISGVTLAPGESKTYLTSYTLTQNDLDTSGGGDGFIENTATADSRETDPVSDTEELEIFGLKALYINKKLTSITDGNDNNVADAVDDVLNYLVTVTNLGTLTLTNTSVVDPSTGLNEAGLTLAPGESRTFETFYTLKQSDLDDNGGGDGYIDNVATADSDQTAAVSDNEATPLLRTLGLGVEKSVTDIAGGKLFVDTAGQVITYGIKVYNAGSVTLTNVTVTDPLSGFNDLIPSLAPGQVVDYTTTYTVKQADLDDNAGGNGFIENVTTADSAETAPVSDDETVPLLSRPLMFVNKTFLNVTGGNGNNLADAVGDQLNYLILVANPGNVTLTDVSVYEPLTNLNYTGLTLAPNQVLTYQSSYLLTQTDLDNNGGGDGYIDNEVFADSTQTPQVSDTESVPILRKIAMSFDKELVDVNGGNGNNLADYAGDQLNYSFTVTNQGSVTLTNVLITDAQTGLNQTLASLAPGATTVLTSSYTLTQSDLDTNGGGDGRVENTATADSDQTLPVTDLEGVTVIYNAQIDLTKYVSVDGGLTWDDANLPTGPSLSSGAGINPQFKYTALNDGTVTLTDIILIDPTYDLNGGAAGTSLNWGDLAPGQMAEFIFTAPFALGQNSGDASVTASALTPVVDIDNAYYLGV